MKKLLALALAMIMALGCVSAFAEEAAPEYGIDTKLQLTLNRSLAPMLMGMVAGNYDEQTADVLMDLLDAVYLDVASGGNVVDMALMANDYPLTALVGVVDEAGVTYVGDLFPHYAVRLEFADLQAMFTEMAQQLEGEAEEAKEFQMPELSEEDMEALTADLMGYVEDVNAFVESVQSGMQASEDGTTVVIPVTSQQLAGLAETLLARLSADEVLGAYLRMIIDQANAQVPETEQVSLEQLLGMAAQKVQELKAGDDFVVAAVTLSQREDGSSYVEVNAMNRAVLGVTAGEDGAYVTLLISEKEITDAAAQMDAILNGTNADDVAIQLSAHSATDENEVTTTAVTLDVLFGGLDVGLALNNSKADKGTVDFVSHTVCALSLNLLGGDLAQLEAVSMAADLPAAPELGDRVVLNAAKLTEEEQQAFIKDVATYGLPAFAAACVQGMPDQVAALVEMGIDMNKLSIVPGSGTEDWESYDYDEYDYGYEEEEDADDGIDLVGTWTAKDGSVLVLNADGTFSVTYGSKEAKGTWEKSYGGLMLDTEQVGMYWDYTEDMISGTIGFDWLEFVR